MSLVDAIPQTIKEIGRIEAGGKAAGGRYGQSIADIGQMVGQIPEQLRVNRSRAMQEQLQTMRLAQAKREEAADLAIQNATTAALLPDGTIDPARLAEHLAGTPAASKLPAILDQFNRLAENRLRLQSQIIDTQEAEDDAIGSIAHAADQAEHPEDKAALLATGFASALKTGTIRKERANQLLAEVLKDDGNPDPEKVSAAIKRYVSGSKGQRTLAMNEAQKDAAAENTKGLKEDREQRAEQRALQNYANQLSAATTQERYGRVYNGIPEKLRGYFDAPEAWTAESSQHAGTVMMTPAERESVRRDAEATRRDKATEAANAAVRTETKRHNLAMEANDAKEKKDQAYAQDFGEYKEWLNQWAEVQKRKSPPLDDTGGQALDASGKPIPPEYDAPPAFADWRRLGKGARVAAGQPGDITLPAQGTQPTSPAPAAATPAAPPADQSWKVGETAYYQGKRVTVTGIDPDGTVRVKAQP